MPRLRTGLLVLVAWLGLAGWASGQGADGAGAPVDEAAKRLAAALARRDAWRALRKASPEEASTEAFQRNETLAFRAAESAFIDALAAAPDDGAAAEEARRFYAESAHWDAPPSAGMLDLIARSPEPAILALRLAGRPGAGGYHGQSVGLLLAGLAVRPGSGPLWADAAEAAILSPDWQIAFLEQSLHCLAPPGSTPEPAVIPAAAAVAERLLGSDLDVGLVPRALALWRGLPPAVRAVVESGVTGRVEADLGGVPLTGELRDLRLDLAAVAMLAGNLSEARRLMAIVAPRGLRASSSAAPDVVASRDSRQAVAARGRELKRRLLDRWLGSPPDDPFELLVQALAAVNFGADEPDSLAPACWHLALARIAEREGYPEIAAHVLTRVKRRGLDVISGNDEIAGTGRGVPPSVLMGARGVAAEIVRLGRELDEDAQAERRRMRAALGPDPAAPVIDLLLRAAPRAAFVERSLPADLEAASAQRTGGGAAAGARNRAREAPLRLPAGFTAVRSERQGKRVVVVAVSQLYDEQSAASAGGYWVLLSDEKGTTWRRPLYTGLRANLPYTVREKSALPLLAGDRLQVEVVVEELSSFLTSDDSGPAELAPRQPRAGIYLDIPLAELERDSDGDGLSDLEEERLLTDPEEADTDHDGIGDAEDPMPTVAAVDTPLPAAGAAAALLDYVLANGQSPPAPRGGAVFGGCCDPAPAAPLGGRTVFVAGERQWFAGWRPAYRLIVLTAEELETLRRKVTAPFFFGIELLVLDRSGRRAYAVWTGANRGGTVALQQKGGTWQAEQRDYWMS